MGFQQADLTFCPSMKYSDTVCFKKKKKEAQASLTDSVTNCNDSLFFKKKKKKAHGPW